MLQWLDNPTPAFAEIARVLKPGCHVVMSTFVDGTLGELKSAFTAIDDAPHVSAFLPTHQIIKNAQEAGFCAGAGTPGAYRGKPIPIPSR